MAARLEKQGALQCAHGPDQTTGRRLRRGHRIRLHDGASRSAIRAKAAGRAEDGPLKMSFNANPQSPNQMITQRTSSTHNYFGGVASIVALLLLVCSTLQATAGKIPAGFTEHAVDVNGVKLHYFIGGKGGAVVLLHGYAETSHMWLPIMPLLAQHHTVIVPDLRGAGDSSKPDSGYDKKNMAVDIYDLTSSLKFDHVTIVGHDIGLMVAYAYAAQFPQ